jgi:hypothetical protein
VASTGQGAKLLGAAVTLVGDLAKMPALFTLAADLSQAAPCEGQPFPNQPLLDKLAEREDALTEQLTDPAVDDGSATTNGKLDLIVRTLKAIAEQRDRLALEQVAWVSVTSTRTATHSSVLDLQQLPASITTSHDSGMADAFAAAAAAAAPKEFTAGFTDIGNWQRPSPRPTRRQPSLKPSKARRASFTFKQTLRS